MITGFGRCIRLIITVNSNIAYLLSTDRIHEIVKNKILINSLNLQKVQEKDIFVGLQYNI